MINKKKGNKGFTLIELMIVIAIIAILAAILVPNFLKARAQGQLTACQSNLKNMGTALEMYSTDNAGRYPDALSKLVSDYLKSVPTCPAAGSDTYTSGYTNATAPDNCTMYCGANVHKSAGIATANYPQYTASGGLITK
jgi:type II secretion system protein G